MSCLTLLIFYHVGLHFIEFHETIFLASSRMMKVHFVTVVHILLVYVNSGQFSSEMSTKPIRFSFVMVNPLTLPFEWTVSRVGATILASYQGERRISCHYVQVFLQAILCVCHTYHSYFSVISFAFLR